MWAIVISVASLAVSGVSAFFTHRKVVEATYAVVGYKRDPESRDPMVFTMHGIVTNMGTQPVTVLATEAYALPAKAGYPRKLLAVDGRDTADFKTPPQIEAGKQLTIDTYAYFDKAFMVESADARRGSALIHDLDPSTAPASVRVMTEVTLFGADGVYRIARSAEFEIQASESSITRIQGEHVPRPFVPMRDGTLSHTFPVSARP